MLSIGFVLPKPLTKLTRLEVEMERSEANILEFISKFEEQIEGACSKCGYKGIFPKIGQETMQGPIGCIGHILGLILLLCGVVLGIIYYWMRIASIQYHNLIVCPNCFSEMCGKQPPKDNWGTEMRNSSTQKVFTPVSELKDENEPVSEKIQDKFLQHFKTNDELIKYKSQL